MILLPVHLHDVSAGENMADASCPENTESRKPDTEMETIVSLLNAQEIIVME